MVTSSTPMPTPAIKRQMSIARTELWHAMITVMTEYHSSAQVKIVAPAELVGEVAETDRADEQPGESDRGKGGLVRQPEQSRVARAENPAAHQPRRDIAGHQQVVQLEPATQRQQDDKLPDLPRGGQPIEPRGNRRGGWCCCRHDVPQ